MNKKNNQRQGFTLIETFVAIVVLMIVVIGPIGMLANALMTATYVKNEVVARHLAQSGIELMLAKNSVATFDASLVGSNPNSEKTYYCISFVNLELFSSPACTDALVPAPFRREITITRLTDGNNSDIHQTFKVVSKISWKNNLMNVTDRNYEIIAYINQAP